ncbi:MAG TPA: hypothetical protein DCQ31_14435 [Bacteroidales bacterium]|nr:hypothetical protein [Bacteroidales bacterium]
MKTNMLLMTVLLTANLIAANAQEAFTKKFNKEFKVTELSILDISNKYGEVIIENGENGRVTIDVTITVKTSNKSKAESLFSKVNILFAEEGNIAKAATEITSEISNTDFSIDYKVKMPASLNLNLLNKYGNVFIDQANGINNIAVKYGDFRAKKMLNGNTKPRSMLDLAYVNNANIEECNWLKIDVSYSKLTIEQSTALIMVSKYSKIFINKCNSIVCESKYDSPFKVGAVANFVCIGKYSDYEIGYIGKKFDIDAKYSDIEVRNVAATFELVKAIVSYGKTSILLPEGGSYNLNAQTDYSSIKYPRSNKLNVIEDNTATKVYGKVGTGENPKAKVEIISKYGDVILN